MILHQFSLKGKTAIVTGCGTGLGLGISQGLEEAGANVLGIYNTHAPKETDTFKAIKADLSSIESVEGIITETLNVFGQIDILINNAGIIRRDETVDFSVKDWDDVMNVNLKTVFFLSQAVARQLIAQERGGKIINIASMLSFQGGIRVPSYTASKSGILGLTKLMANDWAKYGIQVNAIAPGYMKTDNTLALRNDKKRNAEILERIPSGRWGLPEDLMGPAVFLSSAASDYITGHTIAVDGGWLAR